MKYTKDDLANMSDYEVNKTLAEILGVLGEIPYGCQEFNLGDKVAYYDSMRDIYTCNESYCDDWSAIMPLAVDRGFNLGDSYESRYKTELNQLGKVWIATFDGCEFKDIKPQRAIACCLVLVLQECDE